MMAFSGEVRSPPPGETKSGDKSGITLEPVSFIYVEGTDVCISFEINGLVCSDDGFDVPEEVSGEAVPDDIVVAVKEKELVGAFVVFAYP